MAEPDFGMWTKEKDVRKKLEKVVDDWKQCTTIDGLFDRAMCMFPVLDDLTEVQDILQIEIPAANESIAIAKCLTDHANAIILGTAEQKGDIRKIKNYQYVGEKVNTIITQCWNSLIHDTNIVEDEEKHLLGKLKIEEVPYRYGVADKDVRKFQTKELFKGFER